MEAKHTPGPWITDKAYRGTEHVVCANATDGRSFNLASLAGAYPEREANAHLIASAPDLLAACEATLEAYCRERAKLPPGGISQADAAAAIAIKRNARAAIAKARGGAK